MRFVASGFEATSNYWRPNGSRSLTVLLLAHLSVDNRMDVRMFAAKLSLTPSYFLIKSISSNRIALRIRSIIRYVMPPTITYAAVVRATAEPFKSTRIPYFPVASLKPKAVQIKWNYWVTREDSKTLFFLCLLCALMGR
jgi:hypothetical protein